MEFSVVGALVAGFVGTAVMSRMMKMSGKTGTTDTPPMELVHGLVVGLVVMPVMHPRMTGEPAFAGTVDITGGHVELAAPGVLGARWGGMTPVGLDMGHAVYGLVVALVYQARI